MWLRHECAGVANTSRFGAESEQIYLVICDRILLGLTTAKPITLACYGLPYVVSLYHLLELFLSENESFRHRLADSAETPKEKTPLAFLIWRG